MSSVFRSANHRRQRTQRSHIAWFLFSVGVGFWPVLAAFTAIELRQSLWWVSPSNRVLWMPLAALALLCVVAAPLASRLTGWRRLAALILSISAYGVAFVVALVVGARYLHWDD